MTFCPCVLIRWVVVILNYILCLRFCWLIFILVNIIRNFRLCAHPQIFCRFLLHPWIWCRGFLPRLWILVFLSLTEIIGGCVKNCIQFAWLVYFISIHRCRQISFECWCELLHHLNNRISRCHSWIFMYLCLKYILCMILFWALFLSSIHCIRDIFLWVFPGTT